MKTRTLTLMILGTSLILASCSNYRYMSEDDVYSVKQTRADLGIEEADLTSFESFQAQQTGTFPSEYFNPNTSMNGFLPFGVVYGLQNTSIAFHGMGWNDPYYSGLNGFPHYYSNPWFYNQYGWGGHGFYPGYNNHYPNSYGYYYDPYYYDSYYGTGYYYPSPYYNYGNNGIYSGAYTNTNTQPVFYGNRTSLTASSTRSSGYPETLKNAIIYTPTSYANDQTLGSSRREVGVTGIPTSTPSTSPGISPSSGNKTEVKSSDNLFHRNEAYESQYSMSGTRQSYQNGNQGTSSTPTTYSNRRETNFNDTPIYTPSESVGRTEAGRTIENNRSGFGTTNSDRRSGETPSSINTNARESNKRMDSDITPRNSNQEVSPSQEGRRGGSTTTTPQGRTGTPGRR